MSDQPTAFVLHLGDGFFALAPVGVDPGVVGVKVRVDLTDDQATTLGRGLLESTGAETEAGEAAIAALAEALAVLDVLTHATHECHGDPDREPERCRLCEAEQEARAILAHHGGATTEQPPAPDGLPF